MIEFLNPVLLGGLAGVAVPLIIHLLHRRKVKRVDWGAMQFLLELVAKYRRRLLLEELLLLLVRLLAVALLSLALLRPALKRQGMFSGNALVRVGRTAAVLLIDDSLSTATGRAQMALDEMKQLALAYLNSLAPGDEVSLLQWSRLSGPPADPWFDLEAAKGMVAQIKPSAVASDIPALLEAGLAQLSRHLNPGAELVLVHDGRRDGWHAEDQLRWDELRRRLRGRPDATPGTRQRPRLVLLSPAAAPVDSNLAVTGIRADRTLVSAKRPVGIRVEVAHFGKVAPPSVSLRLLVNGRVVGEKALTISAGGRQEVGLSQVFAAPGSQVIEAQVKRARDCLPLDDQRCLALQVESAVPVLLVEGQPGASLQSSLGFLAAALDPEGQGRGPFQLSRVSVSQLNESLLQRHRVVVLGDVPGLTSDILDALERHVVGGGGILVGLGPHTDPVLVNRFWARGGTGFLPAALRDLQSPAPALGLGAVNNGHPVFSAFGPRAGETFKEGRINRYYRLDLAQVKAGELDRLLSLDNGEPLLVERRRGLGLAVLFASTLNSQWNDLPLLPAYVPMMRGVAGRLGSFVMPPRNLQPGERLTFTSPGTNQQTTAEGPSGTPVALAPGVWEGRQALVSEPLLEPGTYTVHCGDESFRYAVATLPAESELVPLPKRALASCFGDLAFHQFNQAEHVNQALAQAGRRSVELWRWLLCACVGALFAEMFLTRKSC